MDATHGGKEPIGICKYEMEIPTWKRQSDQRRESTPAAPGRDIPAATSAMGVGWGVEGGGGVPGSRATLDMTAGHFPKPSQRLQGLINAYFRRLVLFVQFQTI